MRAPRNGRSYERMRICIRMRGKSHNHASDVRQRRCPCHLYAGGRFFPSCFVVSSHLRTNHRHTSNDIQRSSAVVSSCHTDGGTCRGGCYVGRRAKSMCLSRCAGWGTFEKKKLPAVYHFDGNPLSFLGSDRIAGMCAFLRALR